MIPFQTLQQTLLGALILSSFISFSLLTPWGFVSPSDLVLALAVVILGFTALRNDLALPRPDPRVLGLCLGSFTLVTLSTLILHDDLPLSPVVKYAILLLGLPFVLWLARANDTPLCAMTCLRLISNCGAVFVAWLALSLLWTKGGENGGAVSIFGQPIYKNQLGHYLALIATAQFGLWALTGQAWRLAVFALALGLSLALDVRGPVLAALCVTPCLALRLFGRQKTALRRLGMLALLAGMLLAGLIALGLFGPQLARFLETGTPDGGNISSTAARNLLWRYALAQIPEAPWFGQGHGGFLYTEGRGWMAGLAQPHNNILQIALEGGALGLGAFGLLLWRCLRPRADQQGPQEAPLIVLRAVALTYLATTLVDIIWVRGTGHLFWLIAFFLAASPAPPATGDLAADNPSTIVN